MSDIVRNRMMRRAQFPVIAPYIDSSGTRMGPNRSMIPPFHESIVADGIDIPTAIAVFQEALEESYSDFLHAKEESVIFHLDCDEMKYDMRSWRKGFHADEQQAVFGKPHSPIRVTISRNGIIRREMGSSLEIVPAGESMTYTMPKGLHLQEELIEEYALRFCTPGKNAGKVTPDMFYCHGTGWMLTDTGAVNSPSPVFYKNLVIALNNAAVASRYGDLQQGTIL
jgi:hypothetical protein